MLRNPILILNILFTGEKMLSFCDLFCGCGGFSLDFKNAGYEHLGGIDVDEKAYETHALNISKKVIQNDITELHPKEFLDFLGKKPDIILASPPCEGFTSANRKRKDSAYDRLYTHPGSLTITAIDWICDLDPAVGFIIENVPPVATGELKDYIRDEFSRVGYNEIFFNFIDAEYLCSPSRRPRVFISNIEFPEPTRDDDKSSISVLDTIGDLPHPDSIHDIVDHDYVPLKHKKARAISRLNWNKSLLKFQGADEKSKSAWIRLHPYYLAPILMGKSVFIHPFDDRQLTIREYARLQGFPDDFQFSGNYYH